MSNLNIIICDHAAQIKKALVECAQCCAVDQLGEEISASTAELHVLFALNKQDDEISLLSYIRAQLLKNMSSFDRSAADVQKEMIELVLDFAS